MANIIIPTIFAKNKKEFDERFEKIVPLSKNIQIDFMDGKFVESKSAPLSQIPPLQKYKKNFEAHLMVRSPDSYFAELKNKGFNKVIVHVETLEPETLAKAKKLKLKLFLALNPRTAIQSVISLLSKVDGVLFMGVEPGKEGQQFIPEVYNKIELLRKLAPSKVIQVDGGLNFQTAPKLASLKIDFVNSGSLIYRSKKPKETLNNLEKLFLWKR